MDRARLDTLRPDRAPWTGRISLPPPPPLAAPPDLPAGLVERYQYLAPLGEGGMGVVLRVLDRRLDREVALKLVRSGGQPSHGERLVREARALARVQHPNVLRVLDTGIADGQPWMTSELVDGRPLNEAGLGEAEVLEACLDVARGLQAAHDEGILHRDLKPSNALITASGQVVLIDFGLALDPELTNLTATGNAVGSMVYMAPEVLAGDPLTTAADWYSWGVMLFQLLEGRRPFEVDEVLRRSVEPEAFPLRFQVLGPSSRRRRLLERCLRADPTRRPQDLGEVLARLGRPGPAGARRAPAPRPTSSGGPRPEVAGAPPRQAPAPRPGRPPPSSSEVVTPRRRAPAPAASPGRRQWVIGALGLVAGLGLRSWIDPPAPATPPSSGPAGTTSQGRVLPAPGASEVATLAREARAQLASRSLDLARLADQGSVVREWTEALETLPALLRLVRALCAGPALPLLDAAARAEVKALRLDLARRELPDPLAAHLVRPPVIEPSAPPALLSAPPPFPLRPGLEQRLIHRTHDVVRAAEALDDELMRADPADSPLGMENPGYLGLIRFGSRPKPAKFFELLPDTARNRLAMARWVRPAAELIRAYLVDLGEALRGDVQARWLAAHSALRFSHGWSRLLVDGTAGEPLRLLLGEPPDSPQLEVVLAGLQFVIYGGVKNEWRAALEDPRRLARAVAQALEVPARLDPKARIRGAAAVALVAAAWDLRDASLLCPLLRADGSLRHALPLEDELLVLDMATRTTTFVGGVCGMSLQALEGLRQRKAETAKAAEDHDDPRVRSNAQRVLRGRLL